MPMADSAPETQYVSKYKSRSEPGKSRVSAPAPAAGPKRPKPNSKRPDPMAMAAMLRIKAHVARK